MHASRNPHMTSWGTAQRGTKCASGLEIGLINQLMNGRPMNIPGHLVVCSAGDGSATVRVEYLPVYISCVSAILLERWERWPGVNFTGSRGPSETR